MSDRKRLTVRLPAGTLDSVRLLTNDDESLNDFVTDALAREIRRRQGLQAVQSIHQLQDGATPQPDSTALIRALREGHERASTEH